MVSLTNMTFQNVDIDFFPVFYSETMWCGLALSMDLKFYTIVAKGKLKVRMFLGLIPIPFCPPLPQPHQPNPLPPSS